MTQSLTQKWNSLAMPKGALSNLLAPLETISKLQSSSEIKLEPAECWIFCADNGIASDGQVNAYPQMVTNLMCRTFLLGKSVASSLASANGIRLNVANCGLEGPAISKPAKFKGTLLSHLQLQSGTKDIRSVAAMSEAEFNAAWSLGQDSVADSLSRNTKILIFGEMGIGNTSTSTAVASQLLKLGGISSVTGLGAGLPSTQLPIKVKAIEQALERVSTQSQENVQNLLMQLGGYDLVAMTAAIRKAHENRIPVLLDGFIVSVAALCAQALGGVDHLIPATISKEPLHKKVLDALHLSSRPLLDLELCLGEASGALLSFPILKNGKAILDQTATLEQVLELNK